MKFGLVPVQDALGAILAHSVKVPSGRLRKGLVLDADHIRTLSNASVSQVTVARLEAGDVDEDAAATRIAKALLGRNPVARGVRMTKATTGRVNLYSDVKGVVEIDRKAVDALNNVDAMITLATLPEWQWVDQNGLLATVKIISYAVGEGALAKACDAVHGAIRMRPTAYSRASLVQTILPGDDGVKGHRAIYKRMERMGVAMPAKDIVPHDCETLAHALLQAEGEVLFILTASATSDIRDVAPEALRMAGGQMHHFGMPVDPGNLLFIGDLNGKPVIGLPGCARSPALNGADWVMERVLCGVPVGPREIAAMGVGGLLKESPARPHPRERN